MLFSFIEKQKLNTVLADAERHELEITNMSSEAKRYQKLYQDEVQKRQELSVKLDRMKDKMTLRKSHLK
jgi:hypothetical protein